MIEIDCHRWYAVIKEDDTVIGVVGCIYGDGLAVFDSVAEWEASA